MNALTEFYHKLDSSELDVTSEDEINKELQGVNDQLDKDGLTDVLKWSELERKCFALRISFNLDNETGKPTGVSWKVSGVDGNGDPIVWPDINQFSPEDYNYIEERYKNVKNLYAKTHFGLILYFQKPTPSSRHTDFKKMLCLELFELSKYYKEKSLQTDDRTYWFPILSAIQGALHIAVSLRFNDIKEDIVRWIASLHQNWDLQRKDAMRVLLDVTHLVMNYFTSLKSHIDAESILKKNLDGMEVQATKYTWGAIYILDTSAEFDQKAKLGFFNYKKERQNYTNSLPMKPKVPPDIWLQSDLSKMPVGFIKN